MLLPWHTVSQATGPQSWKVIRALDNVKPVQEDGVWTQQPRYTFEGMDFDVIN